MKHKERSGQFVTSYLCKSNEHGKACNDFLSEVETLTDIEGGGIRCHCDCHPTCTRLQCQTSGRKVHVTAKKVCPGCQEILPLTGMCDNCN